MRSSGVIVRRRRGDWNGSLAHAGGGRDGRIAGPREQPFRRLLTRQLRKGLDVFQVRGEARAIEEVAGVVEAERAARRLHEGSCD